MHKPEIKTKLILIEGLPGSGKTTTCKFLGAHFLEQNVDCRWYLETDDVHPIDCDSIKLKELSNKLPPLWRSFVEQVLDEDFLAVIESRLWQNTALFMFMSEYPVEEIVELHQTVWKELADLAPSLIYLHQPDVEKAMKRLLQERDRKLVEKDIHFTSKYPWFQNRGLSDLDGWIAFFNEWQAVAEILYNDFPYRKKRIKNAHEDWVGAYKQMINFVKLA
ncbi:MAG: hypothetical protein DWQ04_13740 [Chloroflexi bacterium]|nr:MAG: hypothetical protein DWQ04_13740 [Chloroflexota bacterium]